MPLYCLCIYLKVHCLLHLHGRCVKSKYSRCNIVTNEYTVHILLNFHNLSGPTLLIEACHGIDQTVFVSERSSIEHSCALYFEMQPDE